MTVKELIEKLQAIPNQSLPVFIPSEHDGLYYQDIEGVEHERAVMFDDGTTDYGMSEEDYEQAMLDDATPCVLLRL